VPADKIPVHATVLEFKPNAVHDSYEGGGFATFHLTRLRLTAPESLAGRELRVLHDRDVPEGSPWRTPDADLCFLAREADLTSRRQLFAGALAEPCP
jgi:hypothetical protein